MIIFVPALGVVEAKNPNSQTQKIRRSSFFTTHLNASHPGFDGMSPKGRG